MWWRSKRSSSRCCSRRRASWQSTPGETRTCAASAGKPLVTVQTCRSCTSTTSGSATSARANVVRVDPGGRGFEEDAARVADERPARAHHQRRDEQAGDRVEAIPARDEHERAGDRGADEGGEVGGDVQERAADVEARPVGAREHERRGEVHGDADERDDEDDAAVHGRRIDEPPDRGVRRSRRRASRSVMPFACAARISARPKPNVHGPRAGRVARRDGDERRGERGRVGEHVARVGEQRERVASDPPRDLDAHEAEDQRERDRQRRRSRWAVLREWPCACIVQGTAAAHARQRQPLRRRRMGEEQQVGETRRREVAEILPRELDMCAARTRRGRRSARGEQRSARALPARRESGGRSASATSSTRGEHEQRRGGKSRRGHRRAERRPRTSTTTAGTAPSRAACPSATCAVAAVAELVRDDELQLRRAGRGEQRVPEDDAPRRRRGPRRTRSTFVVRRLASATSTSRTGTPARSRERAAAPPRAARPRAARNRLKSGSSTTGATKESDERHERERAAAGSGHQRGNARASPTAAAQTAAGEHELDASPFTRSASQPRERLRREAPSPLAHEAAPERRAAARTTSSPATTTTAQTAAAPAQPSRPNPEPRRPSPHASAASTPTDEDSRRRRGV